MARHRPHILIAGCGSNDAPIAVDPAAVRHLEQVLRFSSGEVSYTDGEGLIGTGFYRAGVIERGRENPVDRPTALSVAAAPPRTASRLRFLVEKLAELGVKRLVWLRSAHTEGRPPRLEKAERWAAGALEQSRGAWLMQIGVESIPVSAVAAIGTPVFAEPGGLDPSELLLAEDPILCIGPEGGFAPGEVPDRGLRVDLGPTVLRVETAAVVGVALLRTGSGV